MEVVVSQKDLVEVVTEFRSALQGLTRAGHWFGVSIGNDFPHAACDDSSLLLAAYLTDQGFPGALRIHGCSGGRDGELATHVWLDLEGMLIDITGSQFEDYAQPEILIAREDAFLSSFDIEPDPRIADFRDTEYLPKYDFHKAYEAICGRVLTA
jgi:hypothetical protein